MKFLCIDRTATIDESTTPISLVGVDFPIIGDEGYIIYTKDVWTDVGLGEPCDERKICQASYACGPQGVCMRTD